MHGMDGLDTTPTLGGRAFSALDLEINPATRRVSVGGVPVALTPLEFRLLYLLASHPGVVFDRHAVVTRVWTNGTHVTDRSVDTLVKRLRRKIEPDPTRSSLLISVWGEGYKLRDPRG